MIRSLSSSRTGTDSLGSLLINETSAPKDKLISVRYYAGEPLSYKFVMDAIGAQLKGAQKCLSRAAPTCPRRTLWSMRSTN